MARSGDRWTVRLSEGMTARAKSLVEAGIPESLVRGALERAVERNLGCTVREAVMSYLGELVLPSGEDGNDDEGD